MSISKVMRILRATYLIRKLGGGGHTRPTEIAKYSGVSRSTAYRYLKELERQEMLEGFNVVFRGGEAKIYELTDAGYRLMKSQMELPF